MKELKIYSATCTGICDHTEGAVEAARRWEPDYIAAQGSSADGGAGQFGAIHYVPSTGDINIKRQFEVMIGLAAELDIPFCLGIGGMSGTDLRVEHDLKLFNEIVKEKNLKLRVAVVNGQIDKRYLKDKLEKGVRIKRLGRYQGLPEYLSPEDIDRSTNIVAQMGPEPMMKAFEMDVDGVLTGRSFDPAHHMAFPLLKGFEKGVTTHLAKIIECGAMCAHPCVIRPVGGVLRKDDFLVTALDPEQKCTITSVADHTFYERHNPLLEENPGGLLDLSEGKYEQYDERTVRGWGGRWIPQSYTVKLEGAAVTGYRTISLVATRDPVLIKNIDGWLGRIRKRADNKYATFGGQYELFLHVYGRDGVLGPYETHAVTAHELFILIEVVAKTQDLARSIALYTDHIMKSQDFPGHLRQINLANPSPDRIDTGPAYIFNIWHLLPLEDPCEPFRIRVMDFPMAG